MNNGFIIKGDICYSKNQKELITLPNHYLVCKDGLSCGTFSEIPQEFRAFPLHDYTGRLVIPGLTDLHVHAPQFSYRGLWMDCELLEWLEAHTFPEESKFTDAAYAAEAYGYFADALKMSVTTRACIFATIHREAAEILMQLLDEAGIAAYVGKVNMDRNAPDSLTEQHSAEETEQWLRETCGRYEAVKPILTPRFVPSCSDELLSALGDLQKAYQVPVQSHLSENLSEIEWVKQLCPWSAYYGQVYDRFGLFGGKAKTIMAHCVYSSREEIDQMKAQGVFIAHCPQSNINVASGIAPVRKYLDEGLRVGLGSDVAGGAHISMFRAITDAIQVSKLYWRIKDQNTEPITMPEAFYMATVGGGSFWGKAGSFEKGYLFDAVVISDDRLPHPQPLNLEERLERVVYLSDDRDIRAKYVNGRKIDLCQ